MDEERGVYRVVEGKNENKRTYDFSKMQGRSIEEDLKRRDFTINAMALPIEALNEGWPKELMDPFLGRSDLDQRTIRLISEAALKEDPLRLLRAYRFMAELGFGIESKTQKALQKNHALILKSAPERVRDELYKILAAPDAAQVIRRVDQTGLLPSLLPEAEAMRKTGRVYYGKEGVWGHVLNGLERLDELMRSLDFYFPEFSKPLQDHLMEPVAGYPRYVLLKLTVLLHDVGKPATAKTEDGKLHFYGHDFVGMDMAGKIAKRLRLSNEESRAMSRMVGAHMRPGNLGHQPVLTDRAIYRFYRDLEADAMGMLVVSLADHFTYLSEKEKKGKKDPVFVTIHKMLSSYFLRPETVLPPKLVDGNVLMKKLKLKESPLIGRLLNAIREGQATRKIKTREQALQFAEKLLKSKALSLPKKSGKIPFS
ncbi:MAG: HD domain-containing protein [Elusimicrobia bacterium]|nr:HD domain-containing protein [Elusimicrobiota bacterium]